MNTPKIELGKQFLFIQCKVFQVSEDYLQITKKKKNGKTEERKNDRVAWKLGENICKALNRGLKILTFKIKEMSYKIALGWNRCFHETIQMSN